jgi:protein phosphatase 1 regulatory subunit 7
LESLNSLEQLDIQNNRLTSLDKGITHLHQLKELYLACNRIESIENEFPSPNELSTIDLSTNGLKSLVGAEQLIHLEEFWLSSSGFHSFDDLLPLTLLKNLKCVYLEHSPIAKDFEYRKTVTKMIPTLEQLDATQVHRY